MQLEDRGGAGLPALQDVAAAFTQVVTLLLDRLTDQAETIGRLRAEAGFRRP